MESIPSRPAIWAALIWFGFSAVVGEFFPFSRVAMYASLEDRDEGALPLFHADGEQASVRDFHRFSGGPPQDIFPRDRCREVGGCEAYPCSMEYRPRDDIAWVRDHWDDQGDGPISVTYSYRMIQIVDGQLRLGPDHVVWRGRAWPL